MITTIDPSLEVRGKIIAALKADATLIAIVPAARIYPPKVPAEVTFPYIRLGVLDDVPLRLDGGSGGEVSGVVHCFTKLATSVPDPEKQARQLNGHIARVLDALDSVAISPLAMAITVTQTQVIEDDEPDAWHGIVSIIASAT